MEIKSAEFIKSAVKNDQLPIHNHVEIMFCGRSNVGKSSFINMLCNRKKLAKTSSNPGKTQTLNLFLINNKYYFIDVPGYGYANVSKSIKATFGRMIEEYVCNRDNLKMVCLLVDFRHKPTEDDCLMYEFLKHYNRPVTVIATKSDKVKNSERSKNKKLIIETLNLTGEDKLIITSSEKREGFGLVMQMLDDVVGKHDEYLSSLPVEEETIEE
ncbi:MAG: YihA family ribosome biogenesis GTP-binding protein [Acholeplasmatales bacterium]|nr:YihA family ribosome biogenesis GTP-binding protein [Acholeplasmatales bacterium]